MMNSFVPLRILLEAYIITVLMGSWYGICRIMTPIPEVLQKILQSEPEPFDKAQTWKEKFECLDEQIPPRCKLRRCESPPKSNQGKRKEASREPSKRNKPPREDN